MAVVQELIAKLGFQVDQAGMQKADNSLKGLVKGAFAVAAAYKAAGLVMDSVKRAANLESLNADFKVMLGNAEAARYLVQQINRFAAETPFETSGLAATVKMLMGFGMSANTSMDALARLGDVAQGNQEKLQGLAYAYGQVMSRGTLQGQEVLQFINSGFNPLKEISAMSGKSMAQLAKDMEKGKISADMVAQAFVHATSKGGLFYKGMEEGAKTANGLWSTTKDNLSMISAEIGSKLLPFAKAVMIAFNELTTDIGDAYRKLDDFFGLMFDDGPTAGGVAAFIVAGFETVADVIMLAGTSVQLLRFVFVKAANEIASEALNLADALLWIPKKFLQMLMTITDAAYAFQGWAKGGNTTKDAQRYNATMGKLGGWYEGLGGASGFESTARTAGEAENEANWQKFLDMGAMIGQSKSAGPDAIAKKTAEIAAALGGKQPIIQNNVNVETNIYADGSLKDILTEQANSIIGLGLQTRLQAAMM